MFRKKTFPSNIFTKIQQKKVISSGKRKAKHLFQVNLCKIQFDRTFSFEDSSTLCFEILKRTKFNKKYAK